MKIPPLFLPTKPNSLFRSSWGRKPSSMALILILSFFSSANAQTSDEVDQTIQEVLVEIDAKRNLAEKILAQVPDHASAEVEKIMQDFDATLAARVQERIKLHYHEVEYTLDKISLPPEIGNMELAWEQVKAGTYDSSVLDRLVEKFVEEADRQLAPQRQEFLQFIETEFAIFISEKLQRAQDDIWKPYIDIPRRYFPALNIPKFPAPLLSGLPTPSPDDPTSYRGVLGVIGAALFLRSARNLVARQIPQQIKRKIRRKLLGKAASKTIPFLGIALLALEAWDASRARIGLERNLREGYLESYKTEFTAENILSGKDLHGKLALRDGMRKVLEDSLKRWTRHCRAEVGRLLDASEVASLSPNVHIYIQNQIQGGRDTGEVIEELLAVQAVYPLNVIREVPLRELLVIRRSGIALGDAEFRHLASQLGPQILREFASHREEIFLAAKALGVNFFLDVLRRTHNIDWFHVRTTFDDYPPDMGKLSRQGLFRALDNGVAQEGIPTTTLENIERHGEYFDDIVAILGADRTKIFRLFGTPSLIETTKDALEEMPDAAASFLKHWRVRNWQRYQSRSDFEALLLITRHRLTKNEQPAADLARELGERDELTPIVRDVGICGLQLWDGYVAGSVGRKQREDAMSAIRLFRQGYPCDFLLERNGLEDAQLYDSLPFGIGLSLFGTLGPANNFLYLVVGAFLFFLIVVMHMRRVRKRKMQLRTVRPSSPTSDEGVAGIQETVGPAFQAKRPEVK